MCLELECAQRVRHALDGIALTVREVIRRIDGPRVAGARVRGVNDAIQDWVAQIDVRRSHVDLGAQHARTVLELAGAHPTKKVKVLVGAALAPWRLASRLCQRAAVLANLFGGQ